MLLITFTNNFLLLFTKNEEQNQLNFLKTVKVTYFLPLNTFHLTKILKTINIKCPWYTTADIFIWEVVKYSIRSDTLWRIILQRSVIKNPLNIVHCFKRTHRCFSSLYGGNKTQWTTLEKLFVILFSSFIFFF